MAIKLVIVIPAYNEAERISETIGALRDARGELLSAGYEQLIYVVDDGSVDKTAELANEAGIDRLISHRINKGLGAAIRSGLRAAQQDKADMVVKFDADLQHDPHDIVALLEPIKNDEADIVYGNRFSNIEYRMPFVRRTGNLVFTRLMRWLTGWPLTDSQPGIFGINKFYLKDFYLPGDYNYTQQVLLDAYHKGMRFAHVDVHFRKRTTGKSFVSFKYPFKVLPQILMLILAVRPLRIFGNLGLIFLLVGGIIMGWDISNWIAGDVDKPIQHVNAVLGLSLFGLQTLFFGLLAHLIVQLNRQSRQSD